MATVEQMRVWLVEAENAYHDLQTGKSMVEAQDANGERARYTAANASRLKAYIIDLKRQLGIATANSGPLRPIFS